MKKQFLSIIDISSIIVMLIFIISLNPEQSKASQQFQNNLIALQNKVDKPTCSGPKILPGNNCASINGHSCTDDICDSSSIEEIK